MASKQESSLLKTVLTQDELLELAGDRSFAR
jgi:hypothetical protein